ncbi:uncharacterized protein LOC125534694 [Triticum urartu]|uniref:uncharacterized protein LOC125534694 n=1 Tax=Triticum urartu TaxID=4572 RepID=UPI00204392EA|nr:uncharacterized protein LOC125534694 [Triticum urartu]
MRRRTTRICVPLPPTSTPTTSSLVPPAQSAAPAAPSVRPPAEGSALVFSASMLWGVWRKGKGKAEEVYVASSDQGTTSTSLCRVRKFSLNCKLIQCFSRVIRLGGWCRPDGPTTPTTCTSAPWRRPSCSSSVASSSTTTTPLPAGA